MRGRDGLMPERQWKRSYVTGMTPGDVAALAES
jgi:hypothetical protein